MNGWKHQREVAHERNAFHALFYFLPMKTQPIDLRLKWREREREKEIRDPSTCISKHRMCSITQANSKAKTRKAVFLACLRTTMPPLNMLWRPPGILSVALSGGAVMGAAIGNARLSIVT